MSSYCEIYLANPGRVYVGGDVVEGRVKCYFRSDKNTRGIRLKLKGKEETNWTERESYYDSIAKKTKYRTVNYSGLNEFLSNQINLANESTIPAGNHEYPFRYVLPSNIPGSFQNQYGGIKYTIKATVDIPWKTDYTARVLLTVQSRPVDFRIMPPELQDPIQWEDEKTVCCFCCASGEITFSLLLDKMAFVAGEIIKAKIECTNMSNVNVVGVEVSVEMTIISTVNSPRTRTKEETELVVNARDTGVGAHGQRTYELNLPIPPTTPVYNFDGCALFQQYFDIKAVCEIDGCHSNIDVGGNITVGHIPYGPPPPAVDPTAPQPVDASDIGFSTNAALQMPMPLPVIDSDGFEIVPAEGDNHISMPMPDFQPSGMPMPEPAGGYPPLLVPQFPSAPFVYGSTPSAPAATDFAETPSADPNLPPPSYDQATQSASLPPPYPKK